MEIERPVAGRASKRRAKMDTFGALMFQIVGQQISVHATRAILSRLMRLFGGRLPEPQEVLDADPEALRRYARSLSGSPSAN
jgi:3-methyladenine DNA glycosylase/8-oxoguanine DNA glycosylase